MALTIDQVIENHVAKQKAAKAAAKAVRESTADLMALVRMELVTGDDLTKVQAVLPKPRAPKADAS